MLMLIGDGDGQKTNAQNIPDRRWKCSHIWYSAITSSHTYALSFLLIIHRVFRETGFWKKKKIAFLWLFSLILFQLISSKVKEDRGQVEQIIYIFAQCLFHICWEPNSYLLWNKFIFSWKTDPKPPLCFDVYLQCALCMSTRGIA